MIDWLTIIGYGLLALYGLWLLGDALTEWLGEGIRHD